MPELPEVETVRRGLAPVMEGARFTKVELRRPDLRFPIPAGFRARLEGARLDALDRRGKYLIGALSTGESLVMHLGMSGRFTIEGGESGPSTRTAKAGNPKHDHVVFHLDTPRKGARQAHRLVRVTYNDPRRFGFMDLVASGALESCRHFADMGPEPLGNQFSAPSLKQALSGRSAPIKAALLDQRVVAGLGNIYVCEALYRARLSPRRKAASAAAGGRGDRLHTSILSVLRDAIEAGGSTLRDFAAADGGLGYFQHRFDVYDREGEACRTCGASIRRIVQSGRSTFYCGVCQR